MIIYASTWVWLLMDAASLSTVFRNAQKFSQNSKNGHLTKFHFLYTNDQQILWPSQKKNFMTQILRQHLKFWVRTWYFEFYIFSVKLLILNSKSTGQFFKNIFCIFKGLLILISSIYLYTLHFYQKILQFWNFRGQKTFR